MNLVKKILFFVGLVLSFAATAQIEFPEDKVDWEISVDQNECEATIISTVKIVEHWHINAIYLPEGGFSLPSEFIINPSPEFELVGKVKEPKPHFKHDEAAGEDLYLHDGTVKFTQKIKILSDKDFEIKGSYGFQTCDEDHCLPPYFNDFSVTVKGCKKEVAVEDEKETVEIVEDSQVEDTSDIVAAEEVDTMVIMTTEPKEEATEAKTPLEDNDEDVANMSFWSIFLLSFGAGFAALLTPCVFPMIPMTVSFFTKQSKSKAQGIRNAVFYGACIIIIYVVLGSVVTAVFGADVLNWLSTQWWFNLAFFILLVIFAVSFLGAFEITLPSSWVNKADQASDKGGIIGIFFMALVLALVSFSCTGPIVGTLLVQAADIGGMAPVIGMFGFSLALALPFALFAAFPGWMNTLPKSGGWLNTVKVFLGFLELALAFKFLSNADLAVQAHLLERELFLAIWIAIFAVLAIYLFGKIQLPHDSPITHISVGRALLGVTSLMFVVYMIPGLWGAPLKLISAFPPPMSYSESPLGVGGSGGSSVGAHGPEGTHRGPQGLWVFHDLDEAKAYAKKEGKPLFIDFTGVNCVNCRKMEESVWGEPVIIDYLRDDVVIASLHVDINTELPKEEQKEVEVAGRTMKIKTEGDKWRIAQIQMYNISAQPYYRMLGPNGEDLTNGAASYKNHKDPADFQAWIEKGLKLYDEAK